MGSQRLHTDAHPLSPPTREALLPSVCRAGEKGLGPQLLALPPVAEWVKEPSSESSEP